MGVSEEKLFGKDGRVRRHFGRTFLRNNLKRIRHFENRIMSFLVPYERRSSRNKSSTCRLSQDIRILRTYNRWHGKSKWLSQMAMNCCRLLLTGVLLLNPCNQHWIALAAAFALLLEASPFAEEVFSAFSKGTQRLHLWRSPPGVLRTNL